MKYYIIAGERSGDLHGGNLIKSLKENDSEATFRGCGGEHMKEQGMTLKCHYKELAFMGFWEVLVNLRKISGYLNDVKKDILTFKPDVVVMIDYGGFNLKVASFLKANDIKSYYYITPKVWAWYQSRAKKIKRIVDRMFVILPFEKEFYRKFDWEVDYVGNPVLDAIKNHQPKGIELNNSANKPIVAVLPGSRLQEVNGVLKTVAKVIEQNPDYLFVVAKVDNLPLETYDSVVGLSNVRILEGETYDLLKQSEAAIVTSGTATLETALLNVPQVVVYNTSKLSYLIGRMMIQVNYISLVNLIADRRVVQELIQSDFNPVMLNTELTKLTTDKTYRQSMLEGYNEIQKLLNTGSASDNTAALIVKYLKED